jgi:hypothetical protein
VLIASINKLINEKRILSKNPNIKRRKLPKLKILYSAPHSSPIRLKVKSNSFRSHSSCQRFRALSTSADDFHYTLPPENFSTSANDEYEWAHKLGWPSSNGNLCGRCRHSSVWLLMRFLSWLQIFLGSKSIWSGFVFGWELVLGYFLELFFSIKTVNVFFFLHNKQLVVWIF